MTDKTIQITCEGKAMMALSEIKELQGQLKELSKENYDKLKRSILDEGFAFPLEIAVIDKKPYGILDGHQRLRTVRQMVEREGYNLPGKKLPVSFTTCKDRKQAARLILHAISQYGKVTDEGLYAFVNNFEIDTAKLEIDFDLPDFDMSQFLEGYFEDSSEEEKEPLPEVPQKARAKMGDLYDMGKHRLICGDCTKVEDVARIMRQTDRQTDRQG